jgi:hypothetical protein
VLVGEEGFVAQAAVSGVHRPRMGTGRCSSSGHDGERHVHERRTGGEVVELRAESSGGRRRGRGRVWSNGKPRSLTAVPS